MLKAKIQEILEKDETETVLTCSTQSVDFSMTENRYESLNDIKCLTPKSLNSRKVSFSAIVSVFEYKYTNKCSDSIDECVFEEDVDCDLSLSEMNVVKNMKYFEPYDNNSNLNANISISQWNDINDNFKTVSRHNNPFNSNGKGFEKEGDGLSQKSCCNYRECTIS